MRCAATVPARWHTPAHQCSFKAVADSYCAKHANAEQLARGRLAVLLDQEAKLSTQLDTVRAAIGAIRKHL